VLWAAAARGRKTDANPVAISAARKSVATTFVLLGEGRDAIQYHIVILRRAVIPISSKLAIPNMKG